MLRKRIAAAAAVALTGLTGMTAGSAAAATVSQRDPVGDARAKFDIVRVTYWNNAHAFGYRMKLRNIVPASGTLVFPKLLVNGTWDRFFQIDSGARRDGTRFHRLTFFSGSTMVRVSCPGMAASVNFSTNIVRARVPQTCLSSVGADHQRYKAVGYAATPGMQESGDSTRFRWVNYS